MRRKGASTKDGEERDVESVLDDLYATAPPRFVSRREELAARARTDGRAADARRIRAARRPTLAAWAANLLVRSRPEEARRFLELGQELREAFRTLDAAEIKELSKQRGSVVAGLSRQAATLARDAGHRLSDAAQQDVAATLHAVLADQDAADQWAAGRLQSALIPPAEFPSGTADAQQKPSPTQKPPRSQKEARGQKASQATDELAERRRQKREKLARKAREAAEEAAEQLRERHAEQQDADATLRQARDRHDEARQRVTEAEEQLRRARDELQRAEQAQQEAEERSRETADAVVGADEAARDAAREAERLLDPRA
ncbi:hypothetical protein [Streptomyces sp. NPDC029674]|uniref:hypothetical protein n=1 Tax=Streptomyces sp. NPDC029674 TaxID=3365297 RepID=UPI003851619F